MVETNQSLKVVLQVIRKFATDTEFSSFQQAKFMVDIDVQIPSSFDPFAETKSSANSKGGYVHLRVQQRNGKKSITNS
ncbi:hypothetical protein Patl1_04183 [Pistacia atlantica]|uniref:Uncharacterized protein n=1 Tax=Pistacia atlantica TaxID=434234 RepID=A0ACC1BVV6_9ROSI|nr:hypothetical protein Patl1_04183 [Pistacia atlantica]